MGRIFTIGLALALLALVPLTVSAEDDLDAKLAALDKAPGPEAIAGLESLLEAQTDSASKWKVRVALARRFVREGNAYAALEHYEELVRSNESAQIRIAYAEALVMTARTNLAGGNATAAGVLPYLADARVAVEKVEAEVGTDLHGRLVRVHGESWFYAGEMKKTLAVLTADACAALHKKHGAACWEVRAQALYRTGDMRGAAEAFTKGGNERGAAASWAAAKDADKTVRSYIALLKKTPHDLALLRESFLAVRYAGGVKAMAAALTEVPVEGAWKARYLVTRADLLQLDGQTDESITLLTEAAALDTALVDPLLRIARFHLADIASDPSEARGRASEVLLEALQRDPQHKDVISSLWHLAGQDYQVLWRSAGTGPELERSLRIQRAVLEATPDDALGWANLGNTSRIGGKTEEAIAAYERARAENPYDPAILSDLGLALSAAGRFDEALTAYLDSIKLDDSHLAGRQNAGRALWRQGRDDEADAQLAAAARKARHLDRNPMTYRFLLDRVWRTRQDPALR